MKSWLVSAARMYLSFGLHIKPQKNVCIYTIERATKELRGEQNQEIRDAEPLKYNT